MDGLGPELEIEILTARDLNLPPAKFYGSGSGEEAVLDFTVEFWSELDDWPIGCDANYEEFVYALAKTRLDDIDSSSLSKEWKRIAANAVRTATQYRIGEMHMYAGLPPAALVHRLADAIGGDIWELLESMRVMAPDNAKMLVRRWRQEALVDDSAMYRGITSV